MRAVNGDQGPSLNKEPQAPWETRYAEIVHRIQSRQRWQSIVAGGCCKATHQDIANLRRAVLGADRK